MCGISGIFFYTLIAAGKEKVKDFQPENIASKYSELWRKIS